MVGSSPVQLVVAMYEAAIARTQDAKACLESGDVWGRARAITKASAILIELMASLKPTESSDIPGNLGRLYRYLLRRLQEAHLQQKAAPLVEVQSILTNMLQGWYKVSEAEKRSADSDTTCITQNSAASLGGYADPVFEVEEPLRFAVTA